MDYPIKHKGKVVPLSEFLKTMTWDEYVNRCCDITERNQFEDGETFYGAFIESNPDEKRKQLFKASRELAQLMLTREDKQPWTVINTTPWPLNVNGIYHRMLAGPSGHQVDACPIDQPYVSRVISEVLWTYKEGISQDPEPYGKKSDTDHVVPLQAIPITPKELAIEYAAPGVWVGQGVIPESVIFSKLIPDLWRHRNHHLRKICNLANEWFAAEPSAGHRSWISDREILAAKVLYHYGVILEMPEWAKPTEDKK